MKNSIIIFTNQAALAAVLAVTSLDCLANGNVIRMMGHSFFVERHDLKECEKCVIALLREITMYITCTCTLIVFAFTCNCRCVKCKISKGSSLLNYKEC